MRTESLTGRIGIAVTTGIGLSLLLAAPPAEARKDLAPFTAKDAPSCWERRREMSGESLCFETDHKTVKGTAWAGTETASENGLYRAGSADVTILGFPGRGWPGQT